MIRDNQPDAGKVNLSLDYRQCCPFDNIKIDQSFVCNLCGKPDFTAIVRAITRLGTSLGMTTMAEGVESYEQLAQLRTECCTEVQGYRLSQPCPAGEVAGLLQRSLD